MELRIQISDHLVRALTRRRLAAVLVVALVIAGGLAAAIDTPPYTLEAGKPILATQLNTMLGELYGASVPTGAILPFAGAATAVPNGWLACDGKGYNGNDKQYEALANALGTAWGNGTTACAAGPCTFNVPDLRGMFLRGADPTGVNDPEHGARVGGGAGGVGSVQADAVQSHVHLLTSHPGQGSDGSLIYNNAGYGAGTAQPNRVSTTHMCQKGDQNGGGAGWACPAVKTRVSVEETRPRNAAVLYIVKR